MSEPKSMAEQHDVNAPPPPATTLADAVADHKAAAPAEVRSVGGGAGE